MTLPRLSPSVTAAYLARLGIPAPTLDLPGLASLQAAHLRALPFHNLALLAGAGRDPGLPPVEAAVEGNILGLGGTCHLLTPPFTALLAALGFDAHLAAASCGRQGDHLVTIVSLEGRRFLCDVGNGHPYMRPWPLDGRIHTQEAYGWRFQLRPCAGGGFSLRRALPGGGERMVYAGSPAPRPYAAFEEIIRAHHQEAGYGPFLTTVRAVRITDAALLAVRDATYTRDGALTRGARPVLRWADAHALLAGPFQIPDALVSSGLEALRLRHPERFPGPPAWITAVQEAEARVSREAFAPKDLDTLATAITQAPAPDAPNVLISLATTSAARGLAQTLTSIQAERERFAYPGHVGVLVVDNGPPDQRDAVSRAVEDARGRGLPVCHRPILDAADHLGRVAGLGLIPPPSPLPLPIGSAREAQLALIKAHLTCPDAALPHPTQGPMVVWMIDDDLRFCQRLPDGRQARATSLFHRVARLWATLPERSVILGTYCGDPPIPWVDTLIGQLTDIAGTLERAAALKPAAPWAVHAAAPRARGDDYYDLRSDAVSQPQAPRLWASPETATAGEAILALLSSLPDLFWGRHLTRPQVWEGIEFEPHASLRRGGNTLYLDLDALFLWPTPSVACPDGVHTRRADTLWATLAQRDTPRAVVEAPLPLLHHRRGEGPPPPPNATAAAMHTSAQVRGTALSRALSQGIPLRETLGARVTLTEAHREALPPLFARVRSAITGLSRWTDPELDRVRAEALDTLAKVAALAQASRPLPGGERALERLLEDLPAGVKAWRELWT